MEMDAINHPKHYCEGRDFEPKDVIRNWGLNFNLGSAVKYVSRAGRKDDIVQDLKKAQQFIQFEIDAIEADKLKKAEKPKKDHMWGLDPITRALAEAEACDVKPIVLELKDGVDINDVIKALKKMGVGKISYTEE